MKKFQEYCVCYDREVSPDLGVSSVFFLPFTRNINKNRELLYPK